MVFSADAVVCASWYNRRNWDAAAGDNESCTGRWPPHGQSTQASACDTSEPRQQRGTRPMHHRACLHLQRLCRRCTEGVLAVAVAVLTV